MATQWNSIYQDVSNVLLENGGLQLGILTVDDFLELAAEVTVDFLAKTASIKKLFNAVFQAGVGTYYTGDQVSDIQGALANQQFIFESSDWYISQSDTAWAFNVGQPQQYKQDSLPNRMITVEPAPQLNGFQVATDISTTGYGVIAATKNVQDFDIQTQPLTPAGFGTWAGTPLGNPYVETVNQGYGVPATMVPSTGNLSMFGSALPYNVASITLASYVELVPDMFTPYLKYGILSRIWARDAESKESSKQKYASARYSEGINALAAIMTEMYQEE